MNDDETQQQNDATPEEESQPLTPRSLGGAFADMLRQSEAEQAGKPFYDKTLNYLFQRVSATNKEAANIRSKISKAESALEDTLEENATAQTLFIREYNRRTVVDPKSGELIPNPFVPEDEETDNDEA